MVEWRRHGEAERMRKTGGGGEVKRCHEGSRFTERIQFPQMNRITKYMQTIIPGKLGPPYAMIPSYITEFQSSPVRIYTGKTDREQFKTSPKLPRYIDREMETAKTKKY